MLSDLLYPYRGSATPARRNFSRLRRCLWLARYCR